MLNKQEKLNKKRRIKQENKINRMNNRAGKRAKSNTLFRKIIIVTIFFVLLWLFSIYVIDEYIEIKLYNSDYTAEKLNTNANTVETVDNYEVDSEETLDILEETMKSVVGISKLQTTSSSILSIATESDLGLGTGVIVTSDGYILSNSHVTGEKYSTCYVTLENGNNYEGIVKWSNSDLDLSIVKIEAKDLTYASLGDSSNIRVGESVYAIGNPIGYEFRRTVTYGIISAKSRTVMIEDNEDYIYMSDLIQTDATINPGNSGGPLIYPNGKVIGINTVKITSADGIGFAVPINVVKPIIESFKETGEFNEATLGIYAYDEYVLPYLEENLNFEDGIYVAKIIVDGPSYNSGLAIGDIINSIDGNKITTMNELREYIYSKIPGDTVTLQVTSGNIEKEINIILGKSNG